MLSLERLAVTTAFTALGGWLMTDEEAHLTDGLRARLSASAVREANSASLAHYEDSTPANARRLWLRTKIVQRLGCRICMGLEWSAVAWWATSDRRLRSSPLRAVVEIGAINGAHLLVTKLTNQGTH